MKNIEPTSQPISDIDELLNNSVRNIEYDEKNTELQESILKWKGKRYKVIERVLKSDQTIVKIESKEEIIDNLLKRIEKLEEKLK
jgi:hypothetical protein